jgi:hypothetical protein
VLELRTLTELLKTNEKVFIRLANDNLKQKFMQQAEDEGFVYHGKKPTKSKAESVMIIHKDYTLGTLVGMATHYALSLLPEGKCGLIMQGTST